MSKKSIDFKEILNGWMNVAKSKLGISSEQDEKIFHARREICNVCEHKTDNDRCGKCGCPLMAKTRSLITNCPDERW